MNSECERMRNYFNSLQIPVSIEWLESCIEWCKVEKLSTNYTPKELQVSLYEQWLYLDLREIETASLQENLSRHKKYVLNGNYSLQLMKVIDISRPKHWQLQKIRGDVVFTKNNWQESEAIGTGKRVLQLTLTDGVQEVEAIEYRPIPCLNMNLVPGIKVRLMGPVTIRRGRIMLEEKHIKVLGGNVDEISVSHAVENVLARALKLPENPNPKRVDENMDLELDQTQADFTPSVASNRPHPEFNRGKSSIAESSRQKNSAIKNPSNALPRSTNSNIYEEELAIAQNMLLDDDFEPAPMSQNSKCKSPDLFEDDIDLELCDFDDEHNLQLQLPTDTISNDVLFQRKTTLELGNIEPKSKSPKRVKPDPTSIKKTLEAHSFTRTKSLNQVDEVIQLSSSLEEDDIFENIDIDAHLDEAEKINKVYTIKEMNGLNVDECTLRIHARFGSVVEKLTIVDNEYKLIIKLEDDTGELNVKVHTDLVATLAGFSAPEIIALKSRILENDAEASQTVFKAISSVKDKLLALNNRLEIYINRNEDLPVLMKVL